jgi:rod shape-determining protein MreC
MQKLLQVVEKYYIVFLFLLMEMVGFSLLVNYNTFHQISYLSWVNDVTGGVYQRLSDITEHIRLKEVNQELAEENARLRQQLEGSFLRTNNEFNPYVDTTYAQNYVYRNAQVISNTVGSPQNYMMIDRGSLSGIRKEMGVINGSGLVGIVTDVSAHYATIMSILHVDFNLGVRLKNTNYFGIMHWEPGNPYQSVLHNVQGFVEVQKGDTIETLGASGIFPPGVMVGIVDHFELNPETNNWEIYVELSAVIPRVKHVYVLENLFEEEIQELKSEIE